MKKHIEIYLTMEEYKQLNEIKFKYGLTWKGMLLRNIYMEENKK